MDFIPPLPDPAENQSPAERRIMAERFIKEARHELNSGNRLQAGEKAWGAAVQYLKIIAEQRGWKHTSNRELESTGKHLAAEYPEYARSFAAALSDAYHKGHENFYENRRNLREVREAVEGMEAALPSLETLTTEAPRPFRIASNSELRRLKAITGNGGLEVGDESPVGFSLRHSPNPPSLVRDDPAAYIVDRGRGPMPGPGRIQPLVRDLMQTLLEDFPGLLSEAERQNLMDKDYCRDRLGLYINAYPLLRPMGEGRIIRGHSRYWQKVYAGRYYVTSEWWKQDHRHNADSLLRWVEHLIDRNDGQPGVAALQKRRAALQGYTGSPG